MAFSTRDINIDFLEPTYASAYTIYFYGTLHGNDGSVLLEKEWSFEIQTDGTVDATGDTIISLPAPSTGSVKYDCLFPRPSNRATRAYFYLEAGAQIDLSDLLENYQTAPPALVASYFHKTDDDTDDITEGDNKFVTAAQITKINSVESSADVTDETNVKSALDGATITAETVAAADKILGQDADDSDNLKTFTAQSIVDLANTDLVNDTTPQLGGDLDVNGFDIVSASNGDINLIPNGTGKVGIGTSSPDEKLDVIGNIRVGYDETEDTILSTDVNGDFTITPSNARMRFYGDFVTNPSSDTLTFVGVGAGANNATGTHNTANGYQSLYSNNNGSYNTANGYQSLYSNINTFSNTASGYRSLYSNTNGSYNTANGLRTLHDNTTGDYNTALGYDTGRGITTGDYNTILGAQVAGLAADLQNNIIIADGQGNQRIRVVSDGSVGIGTTSPDEKLDVIGNLRIGYDETEDTILSTDVNGDFTIISSGNRVGVGDTPTLGKLHVISPVGVGNYGSGILTIDGDANYATSIGYANNGAIRWQTGIGSSTGPSFFIKYGGSQFLTISNKGNVGIGTTSPDTKALLDITSTTKVFLPPRMTTTQKNAISPPPLGGVVFDTTLNKLCVYTGSAWETITSS